MRSRDRLPAASKIPWSLAGLLFPALAFPLGLWLLRDHPKLAFLESPAQYPTEFWIIAICGSAATWAGWADWRWHRSGKTFIGHPEHQSEMWALLGGGLPLFLLMVTATLSDRPEVWLTPILVVALLTVVLICYDEFVFHRKRCGRYETFLHRILVLGNGLAWLAWMNWCFVRGGGHG